MEFSLPCRDRFDQLVIDQRHEQGRRQMITAEQFIAKWKATDLKGRAAAQSRFNDLCRLLDEPTPTDADRKGKWYCFERGAIKTTGGEGWAGRCQEPRELHF